MGETWAMLHCRYLMCGRERASSTVKEKEEKSIKFKLEPRHALPKTRFFAIILTEFLLSGGLSAALAAVSRKTHISFPPRRWSIRSRAGLNWF